MSAASLQPPPSQTSCPNSVLQCQAAACTLHAWLSAGYPALAQIMYLSLVPRRWTASITSCAAHGGVTTRAPTRPMKCAVLPDANMPSGT